MVMALALALPRPKNKQRSTRHAAAVRRRIASHHPWSV
jgi:hypothetical protein